MIYGIYVYDMFLGTIEQFNNTFGRTIWPETEDEVQSWAAEMSGCTDEEVIVKTFATEHERAAWFKDVDTEQLDEQIEREVEDAQI